MSDAFSAVARLVENLVNPKQWYPSTDRSISPAAWFLPLAQTAFIASTMLSREARIKIVTPPLLLLASQTRAVTTGDPTRDNGRAFSCSLVVNYVDFGLLLQDGDVYKLKDQKGSKVQIKGGEPTIKQKRGLWQRFKDSAELWLFTMRGIGWNWEVGGIPEREPQSKK